ncbi:hypothetical protein CWE08_05795 [Aliidiomarina iranensis]|uniref:Uncharacterized protein n=1 Tax=Aliidiomarina iranensis TaxID=1434071 RepID=A0A432VWR9_9GAMM|nr:CpcT/CpeT family chromophore lyase [Aliidiomarina iranensis]RUO21106.1 hypothetical protein CWE08_05795 [Aliidiomarina iranensis]
MAAVPVASFELTDAGANEATTQLAQSSQSLQDLTPEAQQERLIDWLTGEFSNLRYVFEFGPVGGYPPLLLKQQRVPLMDGEYGVLVEQSWLAAPERIYRRHLYRFRQPRFSDDIIQEVYVVPNNFAGSFISEDGFSAELDLMSGCSIRWQVKANEFEGYRDGNRCSFRNENNQVVSWTTHLRLNATNYNVADMAFTDDGEQVLGDIEGTGLVLNRIRFFQAEIGYLPAGAEAEDLSQWMVALPQRPLHDHEQRIPLMSGEDGLFLGHDIQLIGNLQEPETLLLRLYRQTEDEPFFAEEMEYQGDGKWRATSERLRIQLSVANSIAELLPH